MTWTKDSLIAFERKVEQAFLDKRIHAPVHLSGGNEDQLIAIFKDVRLGDWVFSTWRSHYHALLKGISEEWVWNEVLAGRSIYLMNAEHRFLSSAIVGGTLPIACGVAMGIKRSVDEQVKKMNPRGLYSVGYNRVWVFVGDMTAETGLFHEAFKYARGQELPMNFVIEDNGMSTNTPTREVWGHPAFYYGDWGGEPAWTSKHYKYVRTYPHVGVGKHVVF